MDHGVRLCKERHILGMANLLRRYGSRGVARCHDDGRPRTVFVHPSRQMDAIHVTWQTSVAEDEANLVPAD